jgi:glycosyltransferase involved in cell wall biosynthesis
MRLGFDVRPFLRRETGVGNYLRNLLFQLACLDRDNEYYMFSASWKDRFPADKVPPFAKARLIDRRIPVRVLNYWWQRWRFPSFDRLVGARMDLVHSPTPLALPTAGKKIITVYDLFFMESPASAGKEAGEVFFKRAASSFRGSDGIITLSSFTRDQLVMRFDVRPEKVRVIPLGVDRRFLEDVPAAELEGFRAAHRLPRSFLLFVGAQEPRKNLPRLIEALKIVHIHGDKVPLVLAGPPGGDTETIRAAAARLGLEEWLTMMGYLPAEDLPKVYRLATALVFPSLCEGFGLPIVEAMAAGLPVVAAMNSAIPEVGADAAVYFPAEDPEALAGKIRLILENAGLRAELAGRGRKRALDFSWEKAAAETLKFYMETGDSRVIREPR